MSIKHRLLDSQTSIVRTKEAFDLSKLAGFLDLSLQDGQKETLQRKFLLPFLRCPLLFLLPLVGVSAKHEVTKVPRHATNLVPRDFSLGDLPGFPR